MLLFLLLQVAPAADVPEIELRAHVTAETVTIQKQGDANLTVRAEPDAGSLVDIRAPDANGRVTIRNYEANVHAVANLADPATIRENGEVPTETTEPE